LFLLEIAPCAGAFFFFFLFFGGGITPTESLLEAVDDVFMGVPKSVKC